MVELCCAAHFSALIFIQQNHFLSTKFSLRGWAFMYRTHTCGELRVTDVNKTVTLAGWVQTIRKFRAITLLTCATVMALRNCFLAKTCKASRCKSSGREFVLQAVGIVQERSNKNSNITTGEIEITVKSFTILNKSAIPPFTITDETDGGDDLRMKYRYLDLRRNAVKKISSCVTPLAAAPATICMSRVLWILKRLFLLSQHPKEQEISWFLPV